MQTESVQIIFFKHIKRLLPLHLSLVDAVADVLNISNDSAYRRIRGDKPIALEEIKKLCSAFKISMDQLLDIDSDCVIFSGKRTDWGNFDFESYLHDFLHQHELINSFEEKELLILPKDVPVYHYYNFPELAAFKYFFWMKTFLNYPEYKKKHFDPSAIAENLMKTGEKILAIYNKIPSTEIWNVENVNTTLRQIEYYIESNVFDSEDDVLKVYDCLERSIDFVELQTESGYKINQPGKGPQRGAPFKVYINDFILGDNTYLPVVNGKKLVFINHSAINYMSTKNDEFAEYTYMHFQNILHKSTLISVVGEKDRRVFFNKIRANINQRKAAFLKSERL